MKIEATAFQGLFVITPDIFLDARGSFRESFRFDKITTAVGYKVDFVQDNLSVSAKNVFRGLHFQIPPSPMAKLVSVVRGEAIDFALDLRVSQPTFGKVFQMKIDAKSGYQIFIPEGFAHGFLALEDHTAFHYKCTAYYDGALDQCVSALDTTLGIGLPENVIMSEKDRTAPQLEALDFLF